jgi:hypothetical protein
MFLLATTALLWSAWRLGPFVAPRGGLWVGPLVVVFLLHTAITGLVLLLGVIGLLGTVPLTVGALGIAAAVAVATRDRGAPDAAPSPMPGPLDLAAGAMLGVSGGLWFANAGWRGTDFVFDDITYHAAVPVHWALTGAIGHTPLTYQSYYPFNAELLGTWSLVLEGHLGNSGTGVLLSVALFGVAVATLLENLRVRTAPGVMLVAALLASPRLVHFSQTFSANDLTVAASMAAALAFATLPSGRRAALFCGLALGAALGTKVSVAVGCLLVGLWWIARGRRDPVLPVLVVVGSLVLGSWWYVHNLVTTGNPLYPAELGPLAGPLDRAAQHRTALTYFIASESDRPGWWRALIHDRLDWPVVLGAASLSGYLVALGAGLDRGRRGAWLVIAVGLSFLALFPWQPYSGSVNRPHGRLHHMVRYLTLPVVLGLPMLASDTRPEEGTDRAVAGLAFAGWLAMLWEWRDWSTLQLGMMGVGLAIGVLLPLIRRPARWAPLLVGLGALLVFAGRTDAKETFTWGRVLDFAPSARMHRPAWQALDALPDGRRVGWLSDLPESHTFALPLYGRRLQHTLVPLDRHGRLLPGPMHTRPPLEDWWAPFTDLPDASEPVLAGVVQAGVDTLVVSRCQHSQGGPWPRPRDLLRRDHAALRLHGDRCVEVWDLAPLGAASTGRPPP